MMKFASLAFVVWALSGSTAQADAYQPVADRAGFLSMIGDRNLTNRLYGVELRVSADGLINGSAAGWDISGTWSWQDGYFCREMEWGGDPIPYSCQLVESSGNELRFTDQQGAGDVATFKLR